MKAMKAMKAKNAIIITGGSVTDYAYYNEYFENADLVICADGGVKHLEKFKIYADYFIGDFDSCDFESFKNCEYVKNAEIIRFKCEKNETDTEIAIDIAIEKNCSEIILIGALGTRFDHSLSNVFLLKKAMDKNVDAVIIGEVGLTGEVRSVSFIEKRVNECKKLGFKKCVIPKDNANEISKTSGIQICGVKNVFEAIKMFS